MNFGNMPAASILVCFLPTTLSITGYACGKGPLNITTYATAGVQECESMTINTNHSEVAFQLLQRVDYEDIGVMRCRVRVEQHICYCGMYSKNRRKNLCFSYQSGDVCELGKT